jgi:hypothetical protein
MFLVIRYMHKIYEDKAELAKENIKNLVTHVVLLRDRLLQNCSSIATDPKYSVKD